MPGTVSGGKGRGDKDDIRLRASRTGLPVAELQKAAEGERWQRFMKKSTVVPQHCN